MDSLKIRVWDFDDKRMIYLDEHIEIVYSGYGNFKLVLGSPFHDDYWSGNVSIYKLMQWTGLQDKNGKDVYEGDVVKSDWHWEGPHVIVCPNDYYVFIEYGLDAANVEIIGNVYEHPELLEVKA